MPESEGASRLIILPGMGADETMYQGPWRKIPGALFLNWPEYNGETTIGEFAESVISQYEITPTDRLCGTSLGGMVALEIAVRLGNPMVILVSSALSPKKINPALRMLSPLAWPWTMSIGKRLVSLSRRPTRYMIRNIDAKFLAAACRAIVNWPGVPQIPGDLHRIHGTND